MKIAKVALFYVQVPFQEPFRISSGEVAVAHSLIVQVQDSQGISGYGEAAPMEGDFYSQESPASCWQLLEEHLPKLLNKEFSGPDDFKTVRLSSPFAQAAVETALWDLWAQKEQQPLWAALGGKAPQKINCGLAIGIYPTIDELLAVVAKYLDKGYHRIKIKIKPGWDLEPVREIRRTFGDLPLFVDANAAYSLADLEIFKELDQYNLMMYEQPFAGDDLAAHAQLARQVQTPVCLDEGIKTEADAREAVRLGSAQIVNIKLQRVGGFGPALAIYQICQDAGIQLWCGTMPELGIGQMAGIHLASLPGFTYPTDLGPSLRFFKDDIVQPLITMDGQGQMEVPEGHGLGVRIDLNKLKIYTVRHQSWNACGM